ncbi:MAG: carboxypeptidase-like regulatory domain-containing protein [Bryobacter sp.]|nr:carboxypeptidase-like regulatory domain-containing protein [Bryobacter sp.]
MGSQTTIGIVLLALSALELFGFPCESASTPCKSLDASSIFLVGKITKDEPYDGPKVTAAIRGPLRKFTIQVIAPLYGLENEKEVVAIASGEPYRSDDGIFWLKLRDYDVIVSEVPWSCVQLDAGFLSRMRNFLQMAKSKRRTGATIGGKLEFQRKALANIELRARRDDGLTRSTKTEVDGEFKFEDLPPGLYTLSVDSERYRVRGTQNPIRVDALSCPDWRWGVSLEELKGAIEGRVSGLQRLPGFLSAVVLLKRLDQADTTIHKMHVSEKESGHFSFGSLEPGDYSLELQWQTGVFPPKRVIPHPSETIRLKVERKTLSGVELKVHERKLRKVKFRFVDQDGDPLGVVFAKWKRCAPGNRETPFLSVRTSAFGEVETDLFEMVEYAYCWKIGLLEQQNPRAFQVTKDNTVIEVRMAVPDRR